MNAPTTPSPEELIAASEEYRALDRAAATMGGADLLATYSKPEIVR